MIELFLMEEYKWTPKQIAEIPYKKIQALFLMRSQRAEAENVNQQRRQLENMQKGGKGGKSYRVIG